MAVDFGKVAGRAALSLGAVTLGAAAGATAERLVMRLSATPSSDVDLAEFYSLHGDRVEVAASDGAVLVGEVDRLPGSRVTIVLPHGFALNRNFWYYQRLALRDRATLVFYDQRGHGESIGATGAASQDYSISQLGRDLHSVINQLAPDDPVILIGHSMGGMSILALVEQHPEIFGAQVIGVGLISSSATSVATSSLGLPTPISRVVQSLVPGVAVAIAKGGVALSHSRWSKTDLGLLITRLYSFGSVAPINSVEFVADMISSTDFNILVKFLPNIYEHNTLESLEPLQQVENLVITGESDRVVPPAKSEAIIERVPGAEFVVFAESGHMVTIERHKEVNELLAGFVDRVIERLDHRED
ncbi:MAG: alpha/beta hydrolase [Candidatus Nanopelagicales bacterium]|nr:alpha/beta fold hydrolase [Actinomycetales bacterium]